MDKFDFMPIIKSKFTNQLIVLPNTKYFFGEAQSENELDKVVRTFDCAGVATVYITFLGTFGFAFHGEGLIPEDVIKNEAEIYSLQEARILFINFVAAAFFGRVSGKKNMALIGAMYNGQDRVTGFEIIDGKTFLRYTSYIARAIQDKVDSELNTKSSQSFLLSNVVIDDAISHVQHVLQRQNDLEHADLQQCMAMNYQAAILHSQQHTAASLALNFSVIESLVHEIFIAYGLVDNKSAKLFVSKTHKVSKILKKDFDKASIYLLTKKLYEGGLFDSYLYQRIESARKMRNNLTHKGTKIDHRDSGDCQTVVRDIWEFLIDTPFELNAGWSYLR